MGYQHVLSSVTDNRIVLVATELNPFLTSDDTKIASVRKERIQILLCSPSTFRTLRGSEKKLLCNMN